ASAARLRAARLDRACAIGQGAGAAGRARLRHAGRDPGARGERARASHGARPASEVRRRERSDADRRAPSRDKSTGVKRLNYAALRALSALQHFGSERLTHTGWLVLGAAGTAGALGIDTSRTMSYQAFTFGAALLLVALVAALFFRT